MLKGFFWGLKNESTRAKNVNFFRKKKIFLEFYSEKNFFLYIRKGINGKFSILGSDKQNCGFFTNKCKTSVKRSRSFNSKLQKSTLLVKNPQFCFPDQNIENLPLIPLPIYKKKKFSE